MRANRPIGSMSLQCAAKELERQGYYIAQGRLFDLLRQLGWIHGLRPTTAAIRDGLLTERTGTYYRGFGRVDQYVRTFITGYGLERLKPHLAQKRTVIEAIHGGECVLGI